MSTTLQKYNWDQDSQQLVAVNKGAVKSFVVPKAPRWWNSIGKTSGLAASSFFAAVVLTVESAASFGAGVGVDHLAGFADNPGWASPGTAVFATGMIAGLAHTFRTAFLSEWRESTDQWNEQWEDLRQMYLNRPHAITDEAEPDYPTYMLKPWKDTYTILEVHHEDGQRICHDIARINVSKEAELEEIIDLGAKLAQQVALLEIEAQPRHIEATIANQTEAESRAQAAEQATLQAELRAKALKAAAGY